VQAGLASTAGMPKVASPGKMLSVAAASIAWK
jgi:hypothetical protein